MNLLHQYIKVIVEGDEAGPVRQSLNISVPADLQDIQKRMESAGMELYLVGGAVRDALMGQSPKDYDVATNAPPEKVTKILQRDPQLQIKPVGESFGVVLVKTPAGNEYEVATFREDIGSGRRPDDVSFTDMETDAQRRDLTMNALFYDMSSQEVIDFVGGIQDIEDGIVRPVGAAADRFAEDPLRILRAVRFAGRTGSELDEETKQAILDDNELREVSPERIRDEFTKGITSAQDVGYFLELTEELGLFEQIFPGLDVDISGPTTQNAIIQTASLLGNNDPPAVGTTLKKIRYSNDESKLVQFLVAFKGMSRETAPQLKKDFKRFKLDPAVITEFAAVFGVPTPAAAKKFLDYVAAPQAGNPQELMAQGIKGPDLGKALIDAEMVAYDEIVGESLLREYIRGLLNEAIDDETHEKILRMFWDTANQGIQIAEMIPGAEELAEHLNAIVDLVDAYLEQGQEVAEGPVIGREGPLHEVPAHNEFNKRHIDVMELIHMNWQSDMNPNEILGDSTISGFRNFRSLMQMSYQYPGAVAFTNHPRKNPQGKFPREHRDWEALKKWARR
jgi:tRNA nucleotidyltransferase/poly(A) polymerase